MKIFGIDVSRWQGDFDFTKAKAEGVKFVIIKAGGADDGLYKDSKFEANYKAAKAAGLGVGVYFFGNAATTAEAEAEARYFASIIQGKQYDYPVFYDVESDRMNVGKAKLSDIVRAFCNFMENAGYWCGFYTNWDWYLYKLNGSDLAERYSFWFAYWADTMYQLPNVQMWQPGKRLIGGVDTDYDECYIDYPSLIIPKGKNGYKKDEPKPTPKPEPKPEELKKGDKIKIQKNAPIYDTDQTFASFVYETVYVVREISGNRVVFAPAMRGAITGAVDKKYVIKV